MRINHTIIAAAIAMSVTITGTTGLLAGDQTDSIDLLTKKLELTSDNEEKAKILASRAVNYAKANEDAKAEQDFFAAITFDNKGWIWAKLAKFYAENKEYDKSMKAIDNINKNFPYLSETIAPLQKHVKAQVLAQYLEENPPEIIMDETPNYSYVSRVQLKNELIAQQQDQQLYSSDVIYDQCKNKWGNNYEMVEYCIKNQTQARRSVAGRPSDEIMRRCKEKWGNNFEMVEYCMGNQTQSRSTVRRSTKDEIYRHCKDKWGDNYEMVEYCMGNQRQSRSNIQRNYGSSSKRAACERKWGDNYEMVEYCMKN